MKKSDLKFGQKVQLRNGEELIYLPIVKGMEFISFTNTFIDIKSMDDDLFDNSDNSCWDIAKVFECQNDSITEILLNPKNIIWIKIWEREEIEEITADEAMRRLEQQSGKKVKIVRDNG